MRVLVHEHLCSLPDADDSLRAEGQAMLLAVLADLANCPAVEPVTLVEPGLVESVEATVPGVEIHPVEAAGVERLVRRLARDAPFSLVIAPEFDDLLASRCEWALEEGSQLLGPTPAAVRLCGDKLRLARHLREYGISTPITSTLDLHDPPRTFPVVCKLRHGAGAQAVFVVKGEMELYGCVALTRKEGCHSDLIVQPYSDGLHASLALLIGSHQQLALVPAEQTLLTRIDNPLGQARLCYAGGRVPLPDRTRGRRAEPLGERAAAVVPGLFGYVGIDLVLGWDESGCDDTVIEINPRLTTSYVGLRRLARDNLMQLLLDVVQGKPVPPPTWHEGAVRFDADGTTH
jgi:predicted ATP-grasp superfamily ATP-dependent carboligase